MASVVLEPKSPALEYAKLLCELHGLFLVGKDEGDEAEAVRDQMDRPWYAMTPEQRLRMRGLSEDLYALAEGGPPRVAMDVAQLAAWRRDVAEAVDGDPDTALGLLRKPSPDALPRGTVARLQARCWERLGDPATAARFAAKLGTSDRALAELLAG